MFLKVTIFFKRKENNLIIIFHFISAAEVDSKLTVQLDSGPIEGISVEGNQRAWLGIPFAQPPLGNFNWVQCNVTSFYFY